ncbi:hypothetical protein ACRALDRAFT_1074870 [Sodiomyces alcalophilus JCM 7366]|uniref:uncharacterized protein n=1 Tax=Sodiomyces alcalophilus JCM 7366 TaxID=591952 RepID=UPI0039B50D17
MARTPLSLDILRDPNTFIVPPRPPLRRPPGPLKLGPHFCKPTYPSHPTRFRFRTRIIYATASPADSVHQNVLRLYIQPSLVQQLIESLVNVLPSPAQIWLESCFPEWTLPPRLVLKQQKEGWDEEFEMEKATYTKLRSLQDVVIPRCFGELKYENKRALLLSDIGGACLATAEGGLLEVADFRRMLRQALDALAPFGISQDDNKLDNYHVVGDKIMAVDLERVNVGLTPEIVSLHVDSTVKGLTQRYEDTQYDLWDSGLIAIDK